MGGGAGGNGGPYPGLTIGFSSPPAGGSTAAATGAAGNADGNMGPAETAGGGGTAAAWDRGTPGACAPPRSGSPFWAGSPP